MFNKIISVFCLVIAALAGSNAHAIVVTLDDNSLTVVRPLSGTTVVNFTGHITLTDGFEYVGNSMSTLWTAGGSGTGDMIDSQTPQVTPNLDGTLFSVTVSALDTLGLYAFNAPGGLAFISFSECPNGGGLCNNSVFNYSLDVVESSVPEPESGALALLGLIGVALFRRKAA